MPTIARAADSTDRADRAARLTRLVERIAARRGLRHVNLAVASGTQRWAGACGPADVDGAPLTPDTPFFVASITKRFVIALALQAYEREELDLAGPVTSYLPPEITAGLHVRRGVDRTDQVTLRHLAGHTSGLPDHFERRRGAPSLFRMLSRGHDTAWTFDDMVTIVRDRQHPHFAPQDPAAPRQAARYSDAGFQLLIRVLESVTGRSFSQLLKERITGPLGLERTQLAADAPAMAPLSQGQRPVQVPGILASSNDLVSTTGELLVFHRSMLAGELFDDPRTIALTTERLHRLRNAPVLRYGLGTMAFRVNRMVAPGGRAVDLIGHSGATGTWLFHCPQLDLHLVGTVDQTSAQQRPFRIMAACLRAWVG